MNTLSLSLSVVSLAVGTLLSLAALWLGWIALKPKRLVYDVAGSELAYSSISRFGNLRLMHGRKRIEKATLTNICLWNSGRGTVELSDLALTQPLTVRVPEGATILSCKVAGCSRSVVNPRVDELDESSCRVSFEFLSHKDWIHLQVLHTGVKPQDCVLTGILKEGRGRLHRRSMRSSRRKLLWVLVSLVPVSAFMTGVLALWMFSRTIEVQKRVAKASQEMLDMEVAMSSVDKFAKLGIMTPDERTKLQVQLEALKPEQQQRELRLKQAMRDFIQALARVCLKSFMAFSLPLGYGVFMGVRLWLLHRIPKRVLYSEDGERRFWRKCVKWFAATLSKAKPECVDSS